MEITHTELLSLVLELMQSAGECETNCAKQIHVLYAGELKYHKILRVQDCKDTSTKHLLLI